MPETLFDHVNNLPAVPFREALPDSFVFADDPALGGSATVEPVALPTVKRDAQGRLTEDAIEAARRLVGGVDLGESKPTDPQIERRGGRLTDDAIAAARAALDRLHTSGETTQPVPEVGRRSTLLERHRDWPQDVTLDYWLDIHGTAKDFAAVTQKIAAADVLIIEAGVQDSAEKASILQDLADKDPSKESPTFLDDYMRENGYLGTRIEPVMRSLYGTHKAVGSFDLKGVDLQHNLDLIAATRRVTPDFSLGSHDATADDFTAKLQDVGRRQRQREQKMAQNVEPEMQRILDSRPDLKAKSSLRVVEPMGKIHSTFREDLSGGDLGLRVEGDIPTDTDFGHRDQVIRRTMRGETDIPRELKMRALSEYVVVIQLIGRLDEVGRQELVSTADFNDYVRDVAAHMSEADMKNVYRNESVDPLTPTRMDRLLISMGLPAMPRDIEGLREAAARMRTMPPQQLA